MAAAMTRRRRARPDGAQSVAEVQKLVDQLIKENRELKRQLAKLEAGRAGTGRGRSAMNPEEKALGTIKRKLERAVGSARTARPSRAAAAARPRAPRRPVSPEVAEKRRQALARARQVRAERRAQAASE